MKKVMSLLLILMLVFGMAACGGNEDVPEDVDSSLENPEANENNEEANVGSEEVPTQNDDQTIGIGQTVNPDDIIMGDGNYNSMEAEHDFEMEVSVDFDLSSIVEKVSYADIEGLLPTMEERLGAAEAVLGGTFSAMGDYEGYDDEDIDKLTYVMAMQNDDVEGIYLEGGVYHNKPDGKHYQYIVMATENCYEVSETNTISAKNSIEKAMGVTIPQENLHDAIETAFEQANKTEDFFALIDVATVNGDGYTETVTVSVEGVAYDEGTIGYYVSCERERCYE